MKRSIGLALLGLVAVACVDELAEGAGEMLVDAGQVLADAGQALADAGSDDASAQASDDAGAANRPASPKAETFEVACDQKLERVTRYVDPAGGDLATTVTTYTAYFAVVNVDTADVVGVDARRCGHKLMGTDATESCTTYQATCEGTARPVLADCDTTSAADLLPSQVRVSCGFEVHLSQGAKTNQEIQGNSFKTAAVTLRRR